MTQVVKYFIALQLFVLSGLYSYSQVSFCAVGDVLLDRGVGDMIKRKGYNYPFESVKEIISGHDLAFFNMECPLAESSAGYPINKRYSFRAEPEYIRGLKYAGFNIASVANNHTIDYGKSGFLKTIELLNRDSIFTTGGGRNQKEAFKPLLIEKNGETFAFFAVLEFLLEGTTFNESKPYPAFGQIDNLCNSIKKINSDIDHIIVSFHWGRENSVNPTSRQIEYAHKVIDAGADLVIGHHPHVLQRIESYRGKLIVYSLGNFVFDNSEEIQKQTVIFKCKFKNGQMIEPELVPVYLHECRPEPASHEQRENIYKHILNISGKFNTAFTFDGTSIKILYEVEKPVKELKSSNYSFNIYKHKIEAFSNKRKIEYIIPDTNYILTDADLYALDSVVYIASIVKNESDTGSRIALFPFFLNRNEFLQPSLDSHEGFNPWKILIADVDDDLNPELVVGVNKATKYDKKKENRIFVFNTEKDYFYPKWLGSKVGNPIIDFKYDHNTNNLIILEESNQTSLKKVVSYKWNGFGFDNVEILSEIKTLTDIKTQFLLSQYHFNRL